MPTDRPAIIPTSMVTAILSVINSDGYSNHFTFNAVPYLRQATPSDIRELIDSAVASSPATEAIAHWEASRDTGVADRLAAAQRQGRSFTVDIDIEEAASFLLLNRPDTMLDVIVNALMIWDDTCSSRLGVAPSAERSISDALTPSFGILLFTSDLFQAAPVGFYPRAAEVVTDLLYQAGFVLGPDTALTDLLDEHTIQQVFTDPGRARRGALYRASGVDVREAWNCEADPSLRPTEEVLQALRALRTVAP